MDSMDRETSPLLNKVSENKNRPKEIAQKYLNRPEENAVRNPYLINDDRVSYTDGTPVEMNNAAQYNRYKYYSKLHNTPGERLILPSHVAPQHLFWAHQGDGKQSSIVTIFAIWNTMLGTSMLSMPWALQQSGFAFGLGLIVLMGIICLYTCLIIVNSKKTMDEKASIDFSDICRHYLGRWADHSAFVFGIIAFLGAIMVYWVLMSNFLFKIGKFGYDHSHHGDSVANATSSAVELTSMLSKHAEDYAGVVCKPSVNLSISVSSSSSTFYKYWDQKYTVPLYLIALLLPLSSFKSPTFFTKFNALGTVSVLYIMIFVLVKAIKWGPHLHFSVPVYGTPTKLYNTGFPAMTGILALALYIHNAILSILQTNEKPENNVRDVSVAYLLTGGTYTYIAVVFYSFFPLDKSCIDQVFLDNFVSSDTMTFIAHCGLFFQMVAVFPLLVYIVRVQVFSFMFDMTDIGYVPLTILNVFLVGMGVLMAIFYPQVGHIIRYVGSVCGMMYIFTLPSLVKIFIQQKLGELTWTTILLHVVLILIGIANLVAQFFVAA